MAKTGTEKLTPTITNFFDFKMKNIQGKEVDFASFKGKTKLFMIVNVACKCGFTGDHYTQLVDLYTKYNKRGLEIFGFPCNQFMSQESGTEEDIEKYVRDNFNVSFPMFSKIEVNGENAHPLYQFLRNNSELYDPETKKAKMIPWNFGKFLVNKDGKVIKFEGPTTNPNDMIPMIEKELGSAGEL